MNENMNNFQSEQVDEADAEEDVANITKAHPKNCRNIITSLCKKGKMSVASASISEDDGIEQNLDEICESALIDDDDSDFFGFDPCEFE